MVLLAASALLLGLPLAAALPTQQPFASPPTAAEAANDDRLASHTGGNKYLTAEIRSFIDSLLAEWDSPGLSVAVVRRDPEAAGGWTMEAEGYGIAGADGRPMTGDSLSAIASNSKLFTAISAGLLVQNETLGEAYREKTGRTLSYRSKLQDLLPEGLWKLHDAVATEQADLVDLLVRAHVLTTYHGQTFPDTALPSRTGQASHGTTFRASPGRAACQRWSVLCSSSTAFLPGADDF